MKNYVIYPFELVFIDGKYKIFKNGKAVSAGKCEENNALEVIREFYNLHKNNLLK